jgi:hypothetical protein
VSTPTSMTSDLLTALATYIRVLAASAEQTNHANDHPAYARHLASAAEMFAAAYPEIDLEALRKLIARERHGYGWSYLSGDPGSRAETAFHTFATFVEKYDT